jgi:hypothetical protein
MERFHLLEGIQVRAPELDEPLTESVTAVAVLDEPAGFEGGADVAG